jgi:hypothetical protein
MGSTYPMETIRIQKQNTVSDPQTKTHTNPIAVYGRGPQTKRNEYSLPQFIIKRHPTMWKWSAYVDTRLSRPHARLLLAIGYRAAVSPSHKLMPYALIAINPRSLNTPRRVKLNTLRTDVYARIGQGQDDTATTELCKPSTGPDTCGAP